MRLIAFISIISSAVLVSATDLATSYPQAAALAQAQENAPKTKGYVNTVLLPSYEENYSPVLQSCFKTVDHPQNGPFSFVAALSADGRVLRIYSDKETNISKCLLAKLGKDKFPAPPESPFYFHVDMRFDDAPDNLHSQPGAPPLVLNNNKYSYTFGVPKAWEFSFEQAHARGADLAFFPKGGNFNTSNAVIYVNEVDSSCEGECLSPLSESVAKILRSVKTDSPAVEISVGDPVKTRDGGTATIRLLKGAQDPRTPQLKDDEALAFLGHEETIILVVLTSRDAKTWDADYAAFREVVGGHKFFTCSSPELAVPCRN